ncbi:hypothetical protein B0T10DRAFT_317824 [Thelonectria olida]|uniref:Uncharacterized protein n=1 Tax=Thelonectria olida TaxID=1576542 RepID=A0A9P9AT30_9HYPO|nr:hypothetical protein B0T10DRAFT_317824 [Thelonectria olida]
MSRLLSPIGQYRQTYTKQTKGKRAAKREKAAKKANVVTEEPPKPPMPELCSKIDVGLNSISRSLESSNESPTGQYSMIFVARGNQSSSFNCQFPLMVGAASKHLAPETKTRLVGFSKPCADRLSTCLGVPRVSSVAIRSDAPGAQALQEFIRKTVAPVDAAWLDQSQDRSYLATIINSIETTVGPKRTRNE